MGATFQNRWEENQKNLYSKEADGKARVAVIKVDGADVADVMKKLAENGYSNVLVRERK